MRMIDFTGCIILLKEEPALSLRKTESSALSPFLVWSEVGINRALASA